MASPDADNLWYGRIAGAAARRAPAWRLGGHAKAAAVAELAEASGGRADLLAKCAGLALGYGERQPEAAHYQRMAELCIAAGADQTLIQRWIDAGRQRAAATAAMPHTGRTTRSPASGAMAARSCAWGAEPRTMKVLAPAVWCRRLCRI